MTFSNSVQMASAAVNGMVGRRWSMGERDKREREREKGKRNEGGGFVFNIHILDVPTENPSVIK